MKRFIAAGILLAASLTAHAESWFQFEGGIGVSHYNDEDGLWINKGLPHDSHLTAPAYRAGIQINAIDYTPGSYVPGLAIHGLYLNFGRDSIRSIAAPDGDGTPGSYNPIAHACNGPCGPERDFVSGGTMQAVAITFEPYWTRGNWRFGVEAGPALFRATWDASATAITTAPGYWPIGSVETFHHVPKWEAGALVGVGACYDAVCVRYNYIFAKTHTYTTTNVPPGFSGAHMLTVNYSF